jgi:hypothetical protein
MRTQGKESQSQKRRDISYCIKWGAEKSDIDRECKAKNGLHDGDRLYWRMAARAISSTIRRTRFLPREDFRNALPHSVQEGLHAVLHFLADAGDLVLERQILRRDNRRQLVDSRRDRARQIGVRLLDLGHLRLHLRGRALEGVLEGRGELGGGGLQSLELREHGVRQPVDSGLRVDKGRGSNGGDGVGGFRSLLSMIRMNG